MILDLSPYTFFKDKKEVPLTLLSQQGYSNKNYQFTYDNKIYLLRKFVLQDRNRTFEFKVQNLAYEKDIAAEAFVLDLKNGLMITAFLEGIHKTTLEREELKSIVSILHNLHSIDIDRKMEILDTEILFRVKTKELKDAFSLIQKYPKTLVLCHNDLNAKNILFYKNIVKLIDWEFAGVNDLYFDLAALSVEYKLSAIDEGYMLESYFHKEGWEKDKLEAYKVIYVALCKKWFRNML